MKRLIAKLRRLAHRPANARSTTDSPAPPPPDPPVEAIPQAGLQPSPVPKSTERNHDSKLEDLPPEVRRYLLSSLDLSHLRTLVHASSIFHEQYLHDRNYVLRRSLEVTLGSAALEAYIVHKSVNSKQITTELLSSYAKEVPGSLLPASLTHEEAQSMAAYYFRLVKPIMEPFAHWMQDNLAKAKQKLIDTQGAPQDRAVPCPVPKKRDPQRKRLETALTDTELRRVTRATYRFQLLCQLGSLPGSWRRREEQQRTILAFFEHFEPWEIEELFTFYQFVHVVYDQILTDITWDLHPENPRFEEGFPPTPPGAFDLSFPYRENLIEGTALRGGLPHLRTVRSEDTDHENLVSTMQEHMVSSYIPINGLDGVFGDSPQTERRKERPSRRDKMQDEGAPCPFLGDRDGPPLAWTIVWENKYSNLYGWYTSDALRRCGYVFWDSASWDTVGIEFVEWQWMRKYLGYDPREDMIYD